MSYRDYRKNRKMTAFIGVGVAVLAAVIVFFALDMTGVIGQKDTGEKSEGTEASYSTEEMAGALSSSSEEEESYKIQEESMSSSSVSADESVEESQESFKETEGGDVTYSEASDDSSIPVCGQMILDAAKKYIGRPAALVSGSGSGAMDSMSFFTAVLNESGMYTEEITSWDDLYSACFYTVDFRAAQPGDILFFSDDGEKISHAGILTTNGMIHVGETEVEEITIDDGSYWLEHFYAYGRLYLDAKEAAYHK